MNHVLPARTETNQLSCWARWGAVLSCLLLLPAVVWAQTSQGGSLADVARQARAQKQAQSQGDVSRAQQVADELSEDQNDGGAPGGFKTYAAGDYKIWVPAPYTVAGHDDAGIVLAGPQVGLKHAEIMVGTPMVVHWQNNDAAFEDTATHLSRLYAQSANCTKTSIASYSAYQCSLAAANLLGHRVSGNAIFVLGTGSVYPLFCVVPTDSNSRDTLNSPYAGYSSKQYARAALDREDADSRRVWQQCDTVFQSFHLSPQAAQQRPAQTGPATAPASLAQTGSTPAGFKVQSFQYCNVAKQCWDASVLVPANAQLVSSDCQRLVFEAKVQATTVLLLAGLAKSECDGQGSNAPSLVRWKQLADPESSRAPGTYSTISSQTTKVEGKPAIIITLGFRNGMTEWMGKRVEVESNGVPLVVGCLGERDHFDDGDAVCSTLIGSLQLP